MPSLKSLKNYLNHELEPFQFINESPDFQHVTVSGTVDRSIRDGVRMYNQYDSILQTTEKATADIIDLSDEFGGNIVGVVSVLPDVDDVISVLDFDVGKKELRFPANFDEMTGEFDANNSLINMVQQFDLYEQIESFFGIKFAWKEQDDTIYFDNYDSDIDTFFITVLVNIDDRFDSTPLKDINIEDKYTYNWIKRFARAKLFERFGRLLQTGEQSVDMNVGGSEMKKEGREDQKELLEEVKNQQPLFM